MALPATDVFTGTNGDSLAARTSWAVNNGAFQIQSNTLQPNGAAAECAGHWTGDTFANDQYSQCTVPGVAAGIEGGVAVRASLTAATATYYGFYTATGISLQLFKNVAAVWTQLGSNGTAGATPTLKLEVLGSTLTPRVNGTIDPTIGQVTDSAIASGAAGVAGFGAGTTQIDNWEGGNLPTLEQEGYRWRDDDGTNETDASWLASQDTDVTRAISTNTRLRIIVNADSDPASGAYQLEVKRADLAWDKVIAASGPIRLSASSKIAAGGTTATTFQLTAPAGKTSGTNFQAGEISDDTNSLPAIDLANNKYTEVEWCLTADSVEAQPTWVYQFRVTVAGTVFATYTLTPQWTIAGRSFMRGSH